MHPVIWVALGNKTRLSSVDRCGMVQANPSTAPSQDGAAGQSLYCPTIPVLQPVEAGETYRAVLTTGESRCMQRPYCCDVKSAHESPASHIVFQTRQPIALSAPKRRVTYLRRTSLSQQSLLLSPCTRMICRLVLLFLPESDRSASVFESLGLN